MSSDPAQLLEFARRYTAAWCSHDPARVAAHFSPGGSLTINSGAPAQGREAIVEAARSFMSSLPDMQVIMNDLLIQGECATYHWTLISATHGVRISGFEEWTMSAEGLIAASLGHFNSEEYVRQLEVRK